MNRLPKQMYSALNAIFVAASFFLVFSFISAASASSQSNEDQCKDIPYGKGKLWEVQKDQGPKSYVFGTMHSADKRILQMPGVIMQALNRSQAFLMETDLTSKTMQQSQQMMLAPHGQKLSAVIGPERHNKLKPIIRKYGIPVASLEQLKVWAVATIISQPPESKHRSKGNLIMLDRELERFARTQSKSVFPLENSMDQLLMFDSLDQNLQLEFLDRSIDEFDSLETELEELTRNYLSGNLGNILCDLNTTLETASDSMQTFMTKTFLNDRNKNMVANMLPYLEQNRSFVAVGALHLPGKEGIINLLKLNGYKVRKRF